MRAGGCRQERCSVARGGLQAREVLSTVPRSPSRPAAAAPCMRRPGRDCRCKHRALKHPEVPLVPIVHVNRCGSASVNDNLAPLLWPAGPPDWWWSSIGAGFAVVCRYIVREHPCQRLLAVCRLPLPAGAPAGRSPISFPPVHAHPALLVARKPALRCHSHARPHIGPPPCTATTPAAFWTPAGTQSLER